MMKHKLTAMLMALLLTLVVNAQRTYPVPEYTGFSIAEDAFSTDTMYLYNVGAQAYLTEGNAWGTQASMGDTGLKVFVNKYINENLTGEDSVWDGRTYLIYDFSLYKNQWKNLFIDSEEEMYVDHGSQGVYCWHFQIKDNGNGTFKIYAANDSKYSHANYPGTYIGVVEYADGTVANTVSPLLNPVEMDKAEYAAFHTDWAFVTKAEYEAQQKKIPAYLASQELLAALEQADVLRLDTKAEKAVFNNTKSSTEELKAATNSVRAKIAIYIETSVSPSSPYSMDKEHVINTTFETSDLWKTTTNAQNIGTASNKTKEQGRDGKYHFNGTFWENWNPGTFTGKMYRQMPQMPHGVYRLELAAFTNSGYGSYIYLNNDSTEVTYGSPEVYQVITLVEETDTVEIGLKVVEPANWVGVDNCHLTYYGNNKDAYAFMLKEVIAGFPTDALFYSQLRTEYEAMIKDYAHSETVEEAMTYYKAIKAKQKEITACIRAYELLRMMIDHVKQAVEDGFIEPTKKGAVLAVEAEGKMEEGLYTAEEALTVAGEVKSALYYDPDPFVGLVENRSFESPGGWLVDTESVQNATSAPPAIGGLPENHNGECWNSNFDYYQILTGLPNGIYSLNAQAFYRTSTNAEAEAGKDTDEIRAWIYLNDRERAVRNVMETALTEGQINSISEAAIKNCYARTDIKDGSGETLYIPNGQTSASVFFTLGLYNNEVYGIVTDGKLRVGIKCEGTKQDRWTCFDNFRLRYRGYEVDVLAVILQDEVERARQLASTPMYRGDKDILLQTAQDAETNAQEAMLVSDGEMLFDIYRALKDTMKVVNRSIEPYAQLIKVCSDFHKRIVEGDIHWDEFIEFVNNVDKEVEEGNYTAAEAMAVTDSLRYMMDYEYNVHDQIVSGKIANPDFDSTKGWKVGTGIASGAFGKELVIGGVEGQTVGECRNSFFDYYQELEGLEPGVYRLKANVYYLPTGDPDTWVNAEAMAFLYADDDTADAKSITALALMKGQITSLFKYSYEGILDDCTSLYGGEGASGYYIPINLRSVPALMAAHEDDIAPYDNRTTVTTVCTDGTLRIGVKGDINNIWSFFDHFSLYRVNDKYMERDELNYQIEHYITLANKEMEEVKDTDVKSLLANAVQQGEQALTDNDRVVKLAAVKALKQALEANKPIDHKHFIEDDKVWKVGITGHILNDRFDMIEYLYFDGDTIIDGKTCKRMMLQEYANEGTYAYSAYYHEDAPLRYIGAWYEENQKVYFAAPDQQLHLTYDFSVSEDDTFSVYAKGSYLNFTVYSKTVGDIESDIESFKGIWYIVGKDYLTESDEMTTHLFVWLEGVGSQKRPDYNVELLESGDHPYMLMSCTVGDEVIYLNDRYEDGVSPDANVPKRRIDFTHTVKVKPKAPVRKNTDETENTLTGDYSDRLLNIDLGKLNSDYSMVIKNQSDSVVYVKSVRANEIVALNIDISDYTDGDYTINIENADEVFSGVFTIEPTAIQDVASDSNEYGLQTKDVIYDLTGRPVSKDRLSRGIYIQNGKKVLVK